MPELFPDISTLILCMLIVAGAQLIYATVGFGAGMFAISLLALVLPDLAGAVATLFLLTLANEISILSRSWREAKINLLIGLIPTTAIGLYLGTHLLVTQNTSCLKKALGVVVLAAGVWFIFGEWQKKRAGWQPGRKDDVGHRSQSCWWSAVAGLLSGTLGGLFGTGGPPVIICLRAYHLDKSAFRATILSFFLAMSAIRAITYTCKGVFTADHILAAAWLLPASLLGMATGMFLHARISERFFAIAVAGLLAFLGFLLIISGGC